MSAKEFVAENVNWFGEQIKKYSFWVIIFLLFYWVSKRVWFWVIMPLMLSMIVKQSFIFYGSTLVINPSFCIVAWVFVFSLLRKCIKVE